MGFWDEVKKVKDGVVDSVGGALDDAADAATDAAGQARDAIMGDDSLVGGFNKILDQLPDGAIQLGEQPAIAEMAQKLLNGMGHDVGTPDGLPGRNTLRGINEFLKENGQPPIDSIDDFTNDHMKLLMEKAGEKLDGQEGRPALTDVISEQDVQASVQTLLADESIKIGDDLRQEMGEYVSKAGELYDDAKQAITDLGNRVRGALPEIPKANPEPVPDRPEPAPFD